MREELIAQLPDYIAPEDAGYAPGVNLKPAFLAEYSLSGQQRPIWHFIYDPSSLEFTYESEAEPGQAVGVNVQPIWFKSNINRTLNIPDLLLHGFGFGKHVGTVIQGLEALRKIDDNRITPKVLSFVWGTRHFGPAIIKSFSVLESMWDSNGNPIAAKVNLELIEVPPYQVDMGRDLSLPTQVIPRKIAPATQNKTATASSSSGSGSGSGGSGSGSGGGGTSYYEQALARRRRQ